MFWWRIKNREVICAADPLALGHRTAAHPYDLIKALNPQHVTNFPQTTPP